MPKTALHGCKSFKQLVGNWHFNFILRNRLMQELFEAHKFFWTTILI